MNEYLSPTGIEALSGAVNALTRRGRQGDPNVS